MRLIRWLAPAALLLSVLAAPAEAATYEIDSAHTQLGFKVRHMVVSWTAGHFADFSGTVALDDADLQATSVQVTVKVASVDTDEEDRDKHLRSGDFFDAEQFPEMTFVSRSVRGSQADNFEVVGDLTIRGVTREVTLMVQGLTPEIKDPWGGMRRGATVSGKINRKDFGMTWNKDLDAGGVVVGDEVYINIEVELVRKG